jgi:hypothetical protein
MGLASSAHPAGARKSRELLGFLHKPQGLEGLLLVDGGGIIRLSLWNLRQGVTAQQIRKGLAHSLLEVEAERPRGPRQLLRHGHHSHGCGSLEAIQGFMGPLGIDGWRAQAQG